MIGPFDPALLRAELEGASAADLRAGAKQLLRASGWVFIADPDAARELERAAGALMLVGFYAFGVRPKRFRGDRPRSRAWAMATRLLPYVASVLLAFGCAGAERTGGEASDKDRGGKLAAELEAGDPDGIPSGDAGQAEPDSSTPPIDGAVDAGVDPVRDAGPDSAQAPRDGGTVPTVDAGPPGTLAGAWHVSLTLLGTLCPSAPPLPREQRWQWDPEASTLAGDFASLSRVRPGVYEGQTGGFAAGSWVTTVTLALEGEGFNGELVRKGASCTDRFDVAGVRP